MSRSNPFTSSADPAVGLPGVAPTRDWEDLEKAMRHMQEATDKMDEQAVEVGLARANIKMHSECCEILRAVAMVPFMNEGLSAVASLARARASKKYLEDIAAQRLKLAISEGTVAHWEYLQALFEGSRTQVSTETKLLVL